PPRMTVRSPLKGRKANANRGAHSCCRESVVQSYLSPKVKLARREGAHRSSAHAPISSTPSDSSPEPMKLVNEKTESWPSPRSSMVPLWCLESKPARVTPPPKEIW